MSAAAFYVAGPAHGATLSWGGVLAVLFFFGFVAALVAVSVVIACGLILINRWFDK